MPSTYTLNNGIELVATGEQSGTWGDTTNTNFTLLDTSLDGQVTVTLGATGSSGSPNALPVSDGATSNGRNRLIIFADSGDLGGTAFVQLTPNDAEKIIYVRNNLSGSRSILLFQGTYNASNDYEVPAGTTAVVFFNGAGSGAVAANVFNNAHFDAMNVVGGVTITTADNTAQLTLISTDADANAGPKLKLRRNSASPADDDLIGALDWTSENSDGDEHDFLNLTARMRDVTAGNEDVAYAWTAYLGGTGREVQSFVNTDASAASMVFNEDSQDIDFRVETNGRENTLFVDGGNDAVVIGESVAHTTISGGTPAFQVSGEGFRGGAAIVRNDNGAFGPFVALTKSRNTTPGSFTIVQDDDNCGTISWFADDGTNLDSQVAVIGALIDGTPGANDTPGRLVFSTTADGSAAATERLRISSNGTILIATGSDLITNSASGINNIRFGNDAGDSIVADNAGVNNVCIGTSAGTALDSGDSNIAIGYNALKTEDDHANNIAIGAYALENQDAGADAYNVAIGYNSGNDITDGLRNVIIGGIAGDQATTIDDCVIIGYNAGGNATMTGHDNVFIGKDAGQEISSGQQNILIGRDAGTAMSTTSNNVVIGHEAAQASIAADQVIIGHKAGYTGDHANSRRNVLVGLSAGYNSDPTSSNSYGNTLIGADAGFSITTGYANCIVGGNSSGGGNSAGYAMNTAVGNSLFGAGAGAAMTSGSNNVVIGGYDGNENGLDIRTSDGNIVLSDGLGNPRITVNGTGDSFIKQNLRVGTVAAGNGVVDLNGRTGTYVVDYIDSAGTRRMVVVAGSGDLQNVNNSYGAISDVKLKENITDAASQWDDIKALTVRKYSMKADNLEAPNQLGVIAQELEAAGMNGLVSEAPDMDADNNDLGTTTKAVKYSILYMKAVKALQEAMTRIEALETKVAALEG